VGGRIDHFTFDGKRKRVIGAALGNNTVEVVDTFAGRDIHSITGAADPQGVVFVGEFNKLFVANGTDGKLRIYDGDSFKLLATVDMGDADPVSFVSGSLVFKAPFWTNTKASPWRVFTPLFVMTFMGPLAPPPDSAERPLLTT
jgi:hypothetical protein